jgi:hypothetical protein
MTNWKKIEEELNQKFKNSFVGVPNFNLKETVSVFLETIRRGKIVSLEEGLKIRYEDNNFDKFEIARKNIATSIEDYFKNIFSFIGNDTFEGTLLPCLTEFFEHTNQQEFWANEKVNFRTTSQNPNSEKTPQYFKSKVPFGDKFKQIYDLRNSITHNSKGIIYVDSYTKDLTDEDSFGKDITDCLIVYLYVTHQYFAPLQKYIDTEQGYDFSDYLENLQAKFRERISRFVHIKGKEDIHLSNTYVVEQKEELPNNNSEEEFEQLQERRGSVDELRKNDVPEKRMMLWGSAGMGKTTTLEYLAYQDAKACLQDSNKNIPVYIALGLLTDKNISIKQSIFNKLNIDTQAGELLLKQGKINLFLDAINEIPQDDNNQLRTYRQREIDNLLKDYTNIFIIITNRPQDNNIFVNIPVFILQQMDNTQILSFLKKNSPNKQVKEKIEQAIDKSQRLKDIIKTPFMLSRLIEVVKRSGEVPTNKGDIIHEFIKCLYVREKVEKKDANFNEKTIHRLLRNLGYQSLQEKGTNAGLSEDEVLNTFTKRKQELGTQIDTIYVLEISTQLGILEKQEGLYTFAHQEYQDYYYNEEKEAISNNRN